MGKILTWLADILATRCTKCHTKLSFDMRFAGGEFGDPGIPFCPMCDKEDKGVHFSDSIHFSDSSKGPHMMCATCYSKDVPQCCGQRA